MTVSRDPDKKDATKSKPKTARKKQSGSVKWRLRLYVAGQTSRSLSALQNLKQLCEERLKGEYEIEVVDLLLQPHLAAGDQIIAVPTLVRRLPPPLKKIIGDLSNSERVLVGLDIRAES